MLSFSEKCEVKNVQVEDLELHTCEQINNKKGEREITDRLRLK